jgi:hypothetical protein
MAPLPELLSGHLYTVAPSLGLTREPAEPPSARHPITVDDPAMGEVRAWLHVDARGDGPLVFLVHGLGGNAQARYVLEAAQYAAARGLPTARLSIRGTERDGEDLYHAGLTADLHAALASPALAGFDTIWLIGYSLGGHAALRASTEGLDPRVAGVAAVCSPLDLDAGARAIDSPGALVYREYILRGLREIHAQVAGRGRARVPRWRAALPRTVRAWDELVVAPRFGFDSAAHYYATQSAGPRLPELSTPALYVGSLSDPMVPPGAARHYLDGAPITQRWTRGAGHVYFPADVDLDLGPTRGLTPQLLSWFEGR